VQYRLRPLPEQKVYFSRIAYARTIYGKSEKLPLPYLKDKQFTLVTGIANPLPLIDFLRSSGYRFEHRRFPDHHRFSASDLQWMTQQEIVLTTEKDYMRLQPYVDKYAFYYLPIRMEILNEQEDFFAGRIKEAAGLPPD
jgi:tetraacyldisaccharide 4'-kinase